MTICQEDGCKKRATFNIPGEKARYCLQHKSLDMIDVFNKKCVCGKAQPRWNMPGLPAMYCGQCKSDNMIEPNRKLCKCEKRVRPCFNFQGLKAEFCNSCKSDDMVNVIDKKCFCGKQTSPLFNYEGLPGKYCGTCKLDGMINVKFSRCKCGKSPSYNYEGLRAEFCSKCKKGDMIDMRHTRCVCGKFQANFNYEGLPGKYCSICKLDDMINTHNKNCITCNKVQPTYNYEGLQPKYCVLCKLTDMIDVRHEKCKTLYCNIRVQDKYDGYCMRCYMYLFPNKPVSKNYKTKETAVTEYILSQFSNVTWTTDKQIGDGCSKRRPDLLLDLGYQVIIVEIDENQHKRYDCSCDNKRLMEISQDLGHRPVIFIRFNPDDYYDKDGKKVKSCYDITKDTGMIKIVKKKEWLERLECLSSQVQYWINPYNKTDKTVEIIQLYYDECIA